jgi:hypothetical protein
VRPVSTQSTQSQQSAHQSVHQPVHDGGLHQNETDLRSSVRELLYAVEGMKRHRSDSPDLRRLALDAQRVAEDVDLLLGPESTTAVEAADVIPDGDYPPGFFGDAEDEGVGRHR